MGDEKPADAAGILAKLEAILGRVKPPVDDDEEPTSGKVPYARFFEANQRAKAAHEALLALKPEVESLRNAQSAAIEAHKSTLAAEVAKMGARNQEDLALRDLGFDGDGRDAVRTAWSRLPETARGKSVPEWWQGQVEAVKAHRADPEKAAKPALPKTLEPYLPVVELAGAEQRQQTNTSPKVVVAPPPRLDTNRGARPATNGGGQVAAIEQAGSWADLMKAVQNS